MDLDEIADELYGLRQDEFTAARDARAAETRKAGERDLAKAIGALRRPTLGAWLINALVRARPDLVEELLQLGDSMRSAQGQFVGDELRRLSRRRTALISELERDAAEVAAVAGQRVNDAMAVDLRSTLEAALADPEIGSAVRGGRLTTGLSFSGFGLLDLTDAAGPEAPRPVSRPGPRRKPEADPAALAAARQALAEARAATEEARRRQHAAVARIEKLDQRIARIAEELAGVRRERDEAGEDAVRHSTAAAAARDHVSDLEQQLAQLEGTPR